MTLQGGSNDLAHTFKSICLGEGGEHTETQMNLLDETLQQEDDALESFAMTSGASSFKNIRSSRVETRSLILYTRKNFSQPR